VLASVGVSCAALVDESSRPCPCLDGYVCCVDVCVPEGAGCADSGSERSEPSEAGPDVNANAGDSGLGAPDTFAADGALDASAAGDVLDSASPVEARASTDAPNGEAGPDAAEAASDAASSDAGAPDAATACPPLPSPRVHFTFADCSDAGIVRDIAGGATGTIVGSGVHCDHAPVGGALRFDGADDAGGGSYVRVSDPGDAGAPGCGVGDACPLDWPFGNAITVSALLDVPSSGSYENILGQWYYADSYIFNTLYDPTTSQQIVRFSVQPAGAAQPVNVTAPLQPAGGPPQSAWSHWVGVYDGASVTLYRDGRAVATQTLDGGAALQCTSVPLELGVVGRQGPCADLNGSYFTGAIGDVQVFDVALSASQVQALECSLGSRALTDSGP
jgi:hypothetical protein